jgi:dipeptidyl aminopeptidase/acylaminoacyl peptidase
VIAADLKALSITLCRRRVGTARRAFAVEDMFRERSVGSAQLSPCGTRVVYTVTTVDRVADTSETALWMADVEGGTTEGGTTPPLRMTARGTNANAPRWSPDGSMLAFLSSRAEPGSAAAPSTQVWALRLAGGEAFKLTSLHGGVETFEWSPDIQRPRLLLSARETLAPHALETKHSDSDEHWVPKAEPWVMDSLQFKQDYVGYLDSRRGGLHLWVQEPAVPLLPEQDVVEHRVATLPKLTQITSGMHTDEIDAAWSPDGRRVAFASNRTPEPDTNSSSNIWVVAADNSDEGKSLVQVLYATNPLEDTHCAA